MSPELEKTAQYSWPFVAMGVVKLCTMALEKWSKNSEQHLERDRRNEDALRVELEELRDEYTVIKTEAEIQGRRTIRLEQFLMYWRDRTVRSAIALDRYLTETHSMGNDPVVRIVLDPLREMPSIEEIEL